MALNFNLLQREGPQGLYEGFVQGQARQQANALTQQANQLAQQKMAQESEINALRAQQMRGTIGEQESTRKKQAQTEKVSAFRERLLRAPTPEAAREIVKMQYADPDLGPILAQSGTLEQSLAEVADDPAQFERYKQQEALGMSEWMKSQRPMNVGGAIYKPATDTFIAPPKETTTQESLLMQQLGYPLTPQGYQDFINAKKPSTLRSKEEEAQAIRIARESRPPAQPRAEQPLEKVVDPVTGKVVFASREEALRGRMTPATATASLKPVPVHAQKAIIGATTSVKKIDDAIAELEKEPKEGATGLKGYLPNVALNRLYPEGTDARAAIADIGSLLIHQRSGAAVTASETPRLLPFVPQITDTKATALKKLKRLKQIQADEAEALAGTYTPEQGFSEFTPGKTTPPAPTVTPSAGWGKATSK